MVAALSGCMAHYIGSELFFALTMAKPGDDVAAILAAFDVDTEARTVVMRRTLRPRHTRVGMLKALVAESGIDASLTMRGSLADFDGVAQALSIVGGLRYEDCTPLRAWDMLCNYFGVRSPRSPGYFAAVDALRTMPGFETARPCEEAIAARCEALSGVPF